jgi:molybdate transport system substrate-binding protein
VFDVAEPTYRLEDQTMHRPIRALIASALLAALALFATAPRAAAGELVVFAAASLKTALGEIEAAWEAETGAAVAISHAGSSALARQIQQGAPADVFVSANPGWMDALEGDDLIAPETRRDLLGNRIVLIAHGQAAPAEIGPGLDLAGMLGEERLAMALVESVPAGIYGKAALSSLGLWESVAPKVAQADNVRAALALVARGEAPYGIVYATDAAAEDAVSVVGAFPEGAHPPIVYPGAVTAESEHPRARAFLEYLASAPAARAFERHGFAVID